MLLSFQRQVTSLLLQQKTKVDDDLKTRQKSNFKYLVTSFLTTQSALEILLFRASHIVLLGIFMLL